MFGFELLGDGLLQGFNGDTRCIRNVLGLSVGSCCGGGAHIGVATALGNFDADSRTGAKAGKADEALHGGRLDICSSSCFDER